MSRILASMARTRPLAVLHLVWQVRGSEAKSGSEVRVKETTEIKKAVETILKPDKDMEPERLQLLLNAQTQLALKLGKEYLEILTRKMGR